MCRIDKNIEIYSFHIQTVWILCMHHCIIYEY